MHGQLREDLYFLYYLQQWKTPMLPTLLVQAVPAKPVGSRELPLEDQVVALVAGCSAGDNFLLLMLVENIR